jgi:hypothetical protein
VSGAAQIEELVDRAAMSAPLVDAAVIAVFHAAGPLVGARVRKLLIGAGFTSGAIVIDMAEFVAAGRLDRRLIDVRYRYGEVDGLDGILADWRRRELLTETGPSPELRDVCRRVLRLRHEVAETIWDEPTATRVADVALDAVAVGGGPLLAAGCELPIPPSPQGRCHHALTLMRWARHGAHAAAWLTRGLGGDEVTTLRTSDAPGAGALVDAVERDTNVWSVPMAAVIGDRFDAWVRDLACLADAHHAERS